MKSTWKNVNDYNIMYSIFRIFENVKAFIGLHADNVFIIDLGAPQQSTDQVTDRKDHI